MTHEQWTAIKNRDESYDGQFFYGIKTTGTVCRPSCKKKSCTPENVIIFQTLEEATSQGFRPCKRCRPDVMDWKGARVELAETVAKYIEDNYTTDFSLEQLAEYLHVNKYYLLRTFKQIKGDTPLVYHNKVRCEKAKELLEGTRLSVADISIRTGYNFPSHFSRVFRKTVGVTPSQYRRECLKTPKE